jgi:hypothetical protein
MSDTPSAGGTDSGKMSVEKAEEILKPFKVYKTFPIFWMEKDEDGNPSAMTTAEAKGFLEGFNLGIEAAAKVPFQGTAEQGFYSMGPQAISDAIRALSREKP